jgi:hypothetical protein
MGQYYSECCYALPWKLEVYDSLGICSECKEHSSFREDYECKHLMNPETCISCKNEEV